MLSYITRRLVLTVPVLFGVATLVFSLIHLVPGDPAQAMLGDGASPDDIAQLRTRLGLDRPLTEQYATLSARARARRSRDVAAYAAAGDHADRRAAAGDGGAGVGGDAGCRRRSPCRWGSSRPCGGGRWVDQSAMGLALVGISVPGFWLGPLLALDLCRRTRVAAGVGPRHAARISCCRRSRSGSALAAILARMTRASVLEELREQYVVAARARGVSRVRAVVVHALRNSLIPVVTILGLQLGAVLTGSIITETIFSWPGVGRLLIQSINFRDYPMVQGCILLIAVTYVTMNLLTDLVYGWLDPRIRFE